MVDPHHPRLSIARQCRLLSVARSSYYRQPASERPETLALMRTVVTVRLAMLGPSTRSSWRRPGTARVRWRAISSGRAGVWVATASGGSWPR